MASLARVFNNYAAKLKAAPAVNVHYVCTAPPMAVEDVTVVDRIATAPAIPSWPSGSSANPLRVRGVNDVACGVERKMPGQRGRAST